MKKLIGIIIGGGVGFAISYLSKCATGTCPLTSNMYVSTTVGGVLGFLLARGR